MAEIRVRNADPKLVDQLEQISKQLNEQTISGTLEKLIPRYHDMQKRIEEQNREIGDLAKLLRAHESLKSNFVDEYEEFVRSISEIRQNMTRWEIQQGRQIIAIKKTWAKRTTPKKNGTKNKKAAKAGKLIRKPAKKKVPSKKTSKSVKRKK